MHIVTHNININVFAEYQLQRHLVDMKKLAHVLKLRFELESFLHKLFFECEDEFQSYSYSLHFNNAAQQKG